MALIIVSIIALLGLFMMVAPVNSRADDDTVPAKNEFNISKTRVLQYTYQHRPLTQVQGQHAWRGAEYAAKIPADAKGVDPQTNAYYIDEWMPDQVFQYFLYLGNFSSQYTSLNDFRAKFTKNDMKAVTEIDSNDTKQNGGTDSNPSPTTYYSTLMAMETLEGLQYATNLTTINLTPDTDVSQVAFGNPFQNGNLWDIGALANLNGLTTVSIQMFSIDDISALANKPNLTSVSLAYNQIADLSPLATNKNNPGLNLSHGFAFQHILLAPITLKTGTNAYTTPSFIIKDLQAHNLPVKPYNSDTEKTQYPSLFPSTTDSKNVDPTTLNWTNFLPDPTNYYGALSSHWADTNPNSDFEGWILVPYQFKDNIGNVNVNYQMLQADGNQLTLAPTTVLSGTVGASYNLGTDPNTQYTLGKLIGTLGYKSFIILDGSGKYLDYLAGNGDANYVGPSGTYTDNPQNRTIIFTEGTSTINVKYGYADPNDATKFVAFNEDGTNTPISVDKEGPIGSALNLNDVKKDFPHYQLTGLGTIDNGKLTKLANNAVLFGNDDKQIVFLYQKVAGNVINVNYVDTDGKAIPNAVDMTISGYPEDKVAANDITNVTKTINGYTFDYYQDAKGNRIGNLAAETYGALDGKLTLVYKKNGNTPTPPNPPTPTPVPNPTPSPSPAPTPGTGTTSTTTTSKQPSTIAKKGEAVYALKKIYLYTDKTFKKTQRIASYAKKPRINRPMFVVTDYAHSKNGRLRYVVKDVNHHSKTAGKKGLITANWDYVRPVYYRSSHQTLTVINPNGVNEYRNKNLTGKVKNYKQGTKLKVKGFVNHNLTTRYLLSNGHYITGNRKLVIYGNAKQPKQIKVKKTIYRYNNANFGKRLAKVKKGTVLKVKKWDYSHQYAMTAFGAKRYQVAGGYVTANSHYVKIVK
ncbi:hypothetical protein FC98_GL001823 [Lentilactobacillus kisonensis DSM 19906 = JCM 15041]|uniref:MucBP domain protein n=1 Tax=Lentilactobacillus kisonensis DSM 19906 = JCM 15041 TaxID=1423766 RepID=A0A0R1NIQ9_9LACO|nr:hypothetical protein FC98_GL001823 [Lentilactobacillus kisonensis DSM 19906 = JCM 15041]